MNIDERLEALTHSVELLASMQKDSEKRLEGYMVKMMQAITRLSNVTAVHTIQVDDHEKRIAELEQ
jgi:hypothetical protein